MVIDGDANMFADFFPGYLIPDILKLVLKAWQSFIKPEVKETEVPITRKFREVLVTEKRLLDLPFTIWRESWEPADSETGGETGRIDIRFLHGWR